MSSPPHGAAPVYLHDLLHAIQTSKGTRPRPRIDKAEECLPIPVRVQVLYRDGEADKILTLEVREWAILAPRRPDEAGSLTLCVTAPAGYEFRDLTEPEPVSPTDEPAPEPAGEVPWTQIPPGNPPEFAGVDPGIFQCDTSKPAGHAGRERIPGKDGGQ